MSALLLDHPGLTEWLIYGERGASSDAIVKALTSLHAAGPWDRSHPYDPSDFRRCETLLRSVPSLRALMPRMADVSPVWAQLVERWDDIVALGESEVPGIFDGFDHGQPAPMMYALIRECHEVPS